MGQNLNQRFKMRYLTTQPLSVAKGEYDSVSGGSETQPLDPGTHHPLT